MLARVSCYNLIVIRVCTCWLGLIVTTSILTIRVGVSICWLGLAVRTSLGLRLAHVGSD
jgi:hypothetical protein